MSRAADRLRADALRVTPAKRPTTAEPVTVEPEEKTPATAGPPRSKPRTLPVKASVLFTPSEHADLARWCAATAPDIGKSRIALSDVLRVLARELVADEALQARVTEVLRRDA